MALTMILCWILKLLMAHIKLQAISLLMPLARRLMRINSLFCHPREGGDLKKQHKKDSHLRGNDRLSRLSQKLHKTLVELFIISCYLTVGTLCFQRGIDCERTTNQYNKNHHANEREEGCLA